MNQPVILSSARSLLLAAVGLASASQAFGGFITFEGVGANAAAITSIRDAFRTAVGGGAVAGVNGSFGGIRREINWDAVPSGSSDPNPLAANFFNINSPRGVVFSTPGTGFLVSNNAGGSPQELFGFPSDFQAFSPQKLFTALNSNITDVNFFVAGTNTAATTTAFGLIFVDVEVAALTTLQFFDASNNLLYTRNALVGGNQGLSFVGAVANGGEQIARVRITSGLNTITANGILGNPNDDVVVMDDFLYAEPTALTATPEPGTLGMLACGVLAIVVARKRQR